MDVRAPYETIFPNGPIKLFCYCGGGRRIPSNRYHTSANSETWTFVHAYGDAPMNLIPADQALVSLEAVRWLGFYLDGVLRLF